jgi:tRNA threonylcarbamoyladenosine biosynthesis protein TsaB
MIVLSIDTSGRNGSVALCRGDSESFEVLGFNSLDGGTYSAQLVPTIAEMLHRSNVSKMQLDGLVVVDGPGSFTGLRVGLSTVKALCEALRKPLAAVSMLEALALTHGHDREYLTVVMDAGRGELYVGEYQIDNGDARLMYEFLSKLSEFTARESPTTSRIATSVPKISEALESAGFRVTLVPTLRSDAVGRIGLRKLLASDTVDPATLDANYVRRSDAELYTPPKR